VAGVLAAYKCQGPYTGATSTSDGHGSADDMAGASGGSKPYSASQDSHRLRADSLLYVLADVARSAMEVVMAAPRRAGVLLQAKAFLAEREAAASAVKVESRWREGRGSIGDVTAVDMGATNRTATIKSQKDASVEKKLPPPLNCPADVAVCRADC
jgi:hypothetical protein